MVFVSIHLNIFSLNNAHLNNAHYNRYKDGLVRLSTTAYKKPEQGNLGELFMHLTNYSLNKHSENFDGSDDVGTGSKRTLRWMLEWLDSHGHNSDALWSNMADVIVKTLLTTLPHNVHAYRESRRVLAQNFRTGNLPKAEDSNCFAIYGFDIFLDTLLKPFVIEVRLQRMHAMRTRDTDMDSVCLPQYGLGIRIWIACVYRNTD